ncbi:MAG: M48 family metallopeptidase [Candidatus Velthaea sp.]
MRRFAAACCIAVVLAFAAGTTARGSGTDARTRFDRRIDAIPERTLLTVAPQTLVDPVRQHSARVLTDVREGLFFAWAFAQIWAFAWLWRSGNGASLRNALRRRVRSRVALRAAFGAVLGILAPLAALPFAFAAYRVAFNADLSEEPMAAWAAQYALGMAADAVCSAVVVTVALELVDRTRLWYLFVIGFLYVAVVGIVAVEPVLLSPLVTPMTPARMQASAPVEIAKSSLRTHTLVARAVGIGPFSRIVVGDVLVASATPPEVAYVIAHEDAHVRHGDVLKLTLIAVTMLVFACAIAVLISDRIGFRRDDDPVSRLALVGAVLGGVALVMLPLYNAYARGIEFRADEDARQTLARPEPAVRFLVRRADDDMVPLCYRRSLSWYFADHPAIGSRMAEMRGTGDPCPRYVR